MATTPVLFVTAFKPDNSDIDRRIQGLAGPGWYLDIDTIINALEAGLVEMRTTTPWGNIAWVKVAKSVSGRKYLTTTADGLLSNNLLQLPQIY